MIALTQEKREELITHNTKKLNRLKCAVIQSVFESPEYYFELEIKSTEITIASLTADVAGHIFRDGSQFYHHQSSSMNMAKAQGEHAIALYTSPPVPEIKFPYAKIYADPHTQYREGVVDGYNRCLADIKRLNGLGG